MPGNASPDSHTFGQRLRDAGVSEEDRALLLGHAIAGMPQHYAAATIAPGRRGQPGGQHARSDDGAEDR